MNISNYGTKLTDDMLLGHIAWWTVTDPKISHDRLMELALTHNLSPAIVPKPPRLGDAFKRACRYSERTGLPIADSPHRANFLIRKVKQDLEVVERHLVLEVVDQDGSRLEYHDAAELIFRRADNVLKVKQRQLTNSLNDLVIETLQIFNGQFNQAAKTIDPQVIRRMVREQLDVVSSIPVRRQGSVYFIPIQSKATTVGLEGFMSDLGSGCVFHSLPLVDTDKQREMIKGAWEAEVHEAARQLIEDLNKAKQKGRKLTPRAWADFKHRYNALQDRFGTYTELTDLEMMTGQIEMDALSTHLTDFIAADLIQVEGQ